MTCATLRSVACELALEMLSGEERAAALVHLETCASCRQDVALLTDAAEELFVLAPDAEPSAGFEQRVLARLEVLAATEAAPPARIMRRSRSSTVHRLLAVAAALIVIVAGFIITARPNERDVAARTADMVSGFGQTVGDVTLATDPDSIVLAVPDWVGLVHSYGATVDAPYWLAVETDDGSRDLYRLPPADEQPWTVRIDNDPATVSAVSVVDNTGAVWCTAQFTSSTSRPS